MRKFTFSFKSLLVACGLLIGSTNAWGDNIYTQDYESDGATADWTTSTNGRFSPTIFEESGNHYLSVNQDQRYNNGATLSSSSLSGKVAAEKDFTLTFDFKIRSSTNQTPVSFTIYDAENKNAIFSLTATGTWTNKWIINGNNEQTIELEGTNEDKAITNHSWFSVQVSRKKQVTYLTITKKADATKILERTIINTLSETGGLGKMEFVTRRYSANFAIDNVIVRDIESGDVPEIDVYKIVTKYQLSDGTQLKNERKEYVPEGSEYNPVYDTTFDDEEYRYTYVSGANKIASVSEEVTFTIVYSREELSDHTVNFTTGGDWESTLESIIIKDGKSYTYTYPRYIANGSILYQIEKDRYDQGFQNTVNNVISDVEKMESYSLVNDGVTFYSEAENIPTLTTSTTNNNIPVRCSNGNAAYAATDAEITTLSPGLYNITAAVFGSAGTSFVFKGGDKELFKLTTAGYFLEATSDVIEIKEKTTIILAASGSGGSSPKVIDYILISRASISVPVSDAGYVTFNSEYPLDLDKISGGSAYIVEWDAADGDKITLTPQAGQVAAYTGLILKTTNGGKGTIKIPVAESGEDLSILGTGINALTSVTEDGQSTEAGDYVLGCKDDYSNIGFYKVPSASPIEKGRAYLMDGIAGAKALYIVFGDETMATGITEMSEGESLKADDNAMLYNLNGQQVTADFKGIVIKNGKKFLNK